jgi:putative radical SAM enzyme (TIGR03279 family)
MSFKPAKHEEDKSKRCNLGKKHLIKEVAADSIAWELGVEPGDYLLSVNDQEIEDVFDYHYLVNDEEIVLLIEKPDGEEWELEIEKEFEDDLGIEFDQGLMDEYRSCRNKCVFCFIDQMPPGMRETLYFKDDDSRLSFLQGNYITLTNMSDHDIDRIIRYHLEPINISFQTTNPELRCKMLHNRFAGEALEKVKRLHEAGIQMNGQIVLCKGLNDKEELERSIRDLSELIPNLQSVSVVPVGLTKFRDDLYPLEPFTKEDACEVLDCIQRWQEKLYAEYGMHFIHAGDEWYLLAGREVPKSHNYDGYLQLENGVGMVRLLIDEFDEAFARAVPSDKRAHYSMATGALAYPYLQGFLERMKDKFPNIQVDLYCIRNDFFGERITVAGLITGQDLIAQLKGRELGEALLISGNMLRSGEAVFLDDITVKDLEDALQNPVHIVKSSGQDFIDSIVQ